MDRDPDIGTVEHTITLVEAFPSRQQDNTPLRAPSSIVRTILSNLLRRLPRFYPP